MGSFAQHVSPVIHRHDPLHTAAAQQQRRPAVIGSPVGYMLHFQRICTGFRPRFVKESETLLCQHRKAAAAGPELALFPGLQRELRPLRAVFFIDSEAPASVRFRTDTAKGMLCERDLGHGAVRQPNGCRLCAVHPENQGSGEIAGAFGNYRRLPVPYIRLQDTGGNRGDRKALLCPAVEGFLAPCSGTAAGERGQLLRSGVQSIS